MKFIYSADLHGSEEQYMQLFEIAKQEYITDIVIGGDLAPKRLELRTIIDQGEFLEGFLKSLCLNNSSINMYVIMGNDDFKDNMKILYNIQNELSNFFVIDKAVSFGDYCIVGYPYVPLTPFEYKDWDKKDVENDNREFTSKGVKSKNGKLVPFEHDPESKDTIEQDMKEFVKKCDSKKAIWITHSPPKDTCLDVIGNGTHVGSIAIKNAIVKYRPLITLHGHIHETVDKTGKFMEKIGKTISMTPGNNPHAERVWYIIVDVEHPSKSKRIQA